MAEGLKIRDLFVSLGFEVDDTALRRVDKSLVSVRSNVRRLSIFMAAGTVAIGAFINEAAKLEQVEIAFETMLGSAEAAREKLDELFEFARQTPFTIPGVLESSKLLLAMGIESERLIDTMKILGDISAGVGRDKLPRLALALGQVRAATKLRGQELRQFTEAGVPLLDELAKSLGKTPAEITDLISAGKVSFEDVRKSLENLTTGSGRFADLMAKQSKTFLGILSNIQDFIIILAQGVGKELLPQAKAIVSQLLEMLEVNRKIIKLKFVEFFKEVGKAIGVLFRLMKQFAESTLFVADAFGGLGNVIKFVTFAILGFTAVSIMNAMGNMVLLIADMTVKMRALGFATLLTNAKLLLIPLLIGAAIVAIGILIEDVIAFFQGKKSITGLVVEQVKTALSTILQFMGVVVDKIKNRLSEIATAIAEKITGPIKSIASFLDKPIQGIAGFIQKGFDIAGLSPATSPASSNVNSQQNTKINAPITVVVPEGTNAEQVGSFVQSGVKEGIESLLRQTNNALESKVAF